MRRSRWSAIERVPTVHGRGVGDQRLQADEAFMTIGQGNYRWLPVGLLLKARYDSACRAVAVRGFLC